MDIKWYKWYFEVLKKYATFEGRASRAEFWWFFLFHILFLASLVSLYINFPVTYGTLNVFLTIYTVYSVATFLPFLAVSVRRFHDTDRTGWWILIGFIPIIGSIILLLSYAKAGTPGKNRFGVSPKGKR